MNAALLSSKAMDWQTPAALLEVVRSVGPIGVDPATTPGNPTGALVWYSSNGLDYGWGMMGLAYVNPPYGRELPKWAAKMASEGRAGAEIIALLPARPDTRWWQDHITEATVVCFWRGRLRFVGAPASAPFPSAVAYWGPRRGRFCEAFAPHGWLTSAAYQVRLSGVR